MTPYRCYESLMDNLVGYSFFRKPGDSFNAREVSFAEIVEPCLVEGDDDKTLYMKLKESRYHLLEDKKHALNNRKVNNRSINGLSNGDTDLSLINHSLEIAAIHMCMNLIRSHTPDPTKNEWRNLTLEEHIDNLESSTAPMWYI